MPETSKIHGDLLRYLVVARPTSPLSRALDSYQPVHPSVNNILIERLKPNTEYNVSIAAINQHGVGVKAAFVTSKSDSNLNLICPAGKIAEKAMWRSVFLCIWYYIFNADSIKTPYSSVTF